MKSGALRGRQRTDFLQDQGDRHPIVERHPALQGRGLDVQYPVLRGHVPVRHGDAGAARALGRSPERKRAVCRQGDPNQDISLSKLSFKIVMRPTSKL